MFTKKLKLQIQSLQLTNANLQSKILELEKSNKQLSDNYQSISEQYSALKQYNLTDEIKQKESILYNLQREINSLEQSTYIQTLGLYDLKYDSKYYKDELSANRIKQKDMLSSKAYFTSKEKWHVNGSLSEGTRLLDFFVQMCISSFNLYSDSMLDKVTIVNIEHLKSRLRKIYDNYNKELTKHKVELSADYLKLKLNEIDLVYKCKLKEEDDKEVERQRKEILKEQLRVTREIQDNKSKLEKELLHWQIQLNKGADVQDKIDDITARIETDDYMLTKTRAGYVYIIQSKSFTNENQMKIGMTRQLNPSDRLAQLSDASIPFKYYPCAIIFAEDAFELETKLHRRLAEYKVNKFNQRKEHFIIDKDKLLKILNDEFKLNVEFQDIVDEEWLFSVDKGLKM